eukprot:2717636-Pyramimonas_sp.AAC.1
MRPPKGPQDGPRGLPDGARWLWSSRLLPWRRRRLWLLLAGRLRGRLVPHLRLLEGWQGFCAASPSGPAAPPGGSPPARDAAGPPQHGEPTTRGARAWFAAPPPGHH